MEAMKGLPSFFQTNAKTVIDELENLALDEGIEDKNNLIDDNDTFGVIKDEETFGEDAFGDLEVSQLPDFFSSIKPMQSSSNDNNNKPGTPTMPSLIPQSNSTTKTISAGPPGLIPNYGNAVTTPSNNNNYHTSRNNTTNNTNNRQYFAESLTFSSPEVSRLPMPLLDSHVCQSQNTRPPPALYASASTSTITTVQTTAITPLATAAPPALSWANRVSGERPKAPVMQVPQTVLQPPVQQQQSKQLLQFLQQKPPASGASSNNISTPVQQRQQGLGQYSQSPYSQPHQQGQHGQQYHQQGQQYQQQQQQGQYQSRTPQYPPASPAPSNNHGNNMMMPGLLPPSMSTPQQTPMTPTSQSVAGQSVLSTLSPMPTLSFSSPKPQEYLGKGRYMTPSDVRFVIGKALGSLESIDPYADDFYSIQFKIRQYEKELALKQQQAQAQPSEGQQAQAQAPPPPSIPMPTWKETKERIRLQMSQMRAQFEHRVKEWEEKEQVLGHSTRNQIHKPRQLLSLPISWDEIVDYDIHQQEGDGLVDDGSDGNNNNKGGGQKTAPFTSRLWMTRQQVQQGYEALFTVQELQQLVSSSPYVSSNALALEEIKREMDNAIQLLSQSLGIKTLSYGNAGHTTSMMPEYSLDGRQLSAILQTVIGKKLLIRGIKLLTPAHRWALIPIILARLLMPTSNTAARGTNNTAVSNDENLLIERKLLVVIADYLRYCYQQQMELQQRVTENANSVYIAAKKLSDNLRQCLKNVMITQMDKKAQLREMLMTEKSRAEIMYLIVQIGDSLSTSSSTNSDNNSKSVMTEDDKMEWNQTKEAFMSLLDN